MTQQPALGAEPFELEDEPVRAGIEPRTTVMLIAGFAAVIIASVATLLPVRYAVLQPGPVLNTLGEVDGTPLISITGRTTYPTSGELDLTTVSVLGGPDRSLTLVQVVGSWLGRSTSAVPEEEVFAPGQTQEQSDAQNAAEMVSSQESATAAALTTLGIPIPTTLSVAEIESTAPAADVLEAGDVIRSVNGETITDLEALRAVLQKTEPGGTVQIEVLRKEATTTVSATTIEADGRTVLGVYIDPKFDFPFNVKIQIEDIGGPSAGSMFALGIIDSLTPGDLTGGKKIAGTGTIDANGTIGPIGGVRQKLVGARDAGAGYFLAPADNCGEVQGHVPDGLQVVKVADLDEALAAVTAIGTDQAAGLATC